MKKIIILMVLSLMFASQTWVTYIRKQITENIFADPIITGMVANLLYSNPLNDLQFLAYIEDSNVEQIISDNADFNIELIDDKDETLLNWEYIITVDQIVSMDKIITGDI